MSAIPVTVCVCDKAQLNRTDDTIEKLKSVRNICKETNMSKKNRHHV